VVFYVNSHHPANKWYKLEHVFYYHKPDGKIICPECIGVGVKVGVDLMHPCICHHCKGEGRINKE